MKKLVDYGLTAQEAAQLVRGVADGQYHLLTGAGSSYGAPGGDGVLLTDGRTFAKQVCDEFNLPLVGGDRENLQLAHEEADAAEPARLKNWLKRRFTKCTPTWQSVLFRFAWNRIWTFNIDDVLERAFDPADAANQFKELESIDWKQPLQASADLAKVQVVHLHGRAVDLGTKNEGLVFSVPEYGNAAKSFQHWHAGFQTHYIERPFIVCGASLSSEVDLADAIRNKNEAKASTGYPSVVLWHSADEPTKNRMRRYHLIPVVADANEFFLSLHAEVSAYRSKYQAGFDKLSPGTFERFITQFRRMQVDGTPGAYIAGSDFYGGDEPVWDDILNDRDAVFRRTKVAASLLDVGGDRQFAVLVHGDAGSGKSTALLRIAREAIRKGYDPYMFREEEGLHVPATAEYLKFNKKAVLFIDNASSQLFAVAKLLSAMKAAGSACRIYLAMRSNRIRGFRIDIPDEFRDDYRLELDKLDLRDLVIRRRAAARLGKHVSKTDDWLIAELFKLFNNSLLDSVSYIEFSEGHRARVRRLVVEELSDPTRKKLIARVACVHRFGFSLPLRAAMAASNLPFKEFSALVDDSLKAEQALVRDASGLRLRHRILSEYAWMNAFDEQERYEAMSAVVFALAPLVNKAVVKARGIEHLILREVLNREMVSHALGSEARKFYEVHEDLLGWSSRYWDQRALLESKVYANFPKAYSFSQKAISLERHEFAFTSLGSICLDHAGELAKTNLDEALVTFLEGNDALTTAYNIAEQDGRSHEHPFVTFFAGATWLLRNMREAVPATETIFQLYDIWIQRAEAAQIFATAYGQKRLNQIRATRMKEELRLRRGRN